MVINGLNPNNLEWLLERLAETSRLLQMEGCEKPYRFILLTKSAEERHKVENAIFAYLQVRYGVQLVTKMVENRSFSNFSLFVINIHCFELLLLDLE